MADKELPKEEKEDERDLDPDTLKYIEHSWPDTDFFVVAKDIQKAHLARKAAGHVC